MRIRRFSVLILLAQVCLTAQAARPGASDYCTLAKTLLAPAKNNPCFDQLLTKAKNGDDRKWLLEQARTWSPPSDLTLVLLPSGFAAYLGAKPIGKMQWLRRDPAVLYWNGKIKMLPLGVKPSASISKTLQLLTQDQTEARFDFSVFPQAFAQSTNTNLMTKVATFFTLGFAATTAADFMASSDSLTNIFPEVGRLQSFLGGHEVQCSKNGVQNLEFPLKNGRVLRLNSTAEDEFNIEGLSAGLVLHARYNPTPIGQDSLVCLSVFSAGSDSKTCQPLWDEFVAANPAAQEQLKKNPQIGLNCQSFPPAVQQRCLRFWEGKVEALRNYRPPQAFKTQNKTLYLSACTDASCSQMKPLDRVEQLGGLVEPSGPSSESELQLGKTGVSIQQGFMVTKLVEQAVMGARVLAECCKTKECRDVAYQKRSLKLIPATETPTTSQ